MLNSINALKLLLAAQNLIEYVNNNGFHDFDEATQQEFDDCQSIMADTVKICGTSVATYALSKVLKNCNLFNEETVNVIKDFLEDAEELEKEEA